MADYGYTVEVVDGYEEAVTRARLALRGEGFSIITEMDVGGLLDVPGDNARQYLFMGSWDTGVTRTQADTTVAIHLPCNVVVQETTGAALVAALDPHDDVDLSDPEAARLADDAGAALERALATIAAA